MSKPPNDINPILSQAERDLYFTDPGYELFGSSLTNVKRIFRKKPWFSQKMNLQGRILQATITLCISMIGMGLGFTFLKIPPRMEAVRLLLTHGYRGPYYGLQVIDMQLFPAFSTEASTVAAEITVYNFENKIELGKPIEMTLKQKDSTRQSLHTIDCCTNPIGPHKKTIIQTVIKEKSFRIDQVEAKTLN